jgi:hypothetical protein
VTILFSNLFLFAVKLWLVDFDFVCWLFVYEIIIEDDDDEDLESSTRPDPVFL